MYVYMQLLFLCHSFHYFFFPTLEVPQQCYLLLGASPVLVLFPQAHMRPYGSPCPICSLMRDLRKRREHSAVWSRGGSGYATWKYIPLAKGWFELEANENQQMQKEAPPALPCLPTSRHRREVQAARIPLPGSWGDEEGGKLAPRRYCTKTYSILSPIYLSSHSLPPFEA